MLIRKSGYWFLPDADVSAKKWTPPPDLVKFIDAAHADGKKVVYIGFGSIVVSDPKTMTRCVVDAVLRSGVRAILSKGWSDRLQAKASDASEPEVPLPKEIYPIPSIPHDWLFQRIGKNQVLCSSNRLEYFSARRMLPSRRRRDYWGQFTRYVISVGDGHLDAKVS